MTGSGSGGSGRCSGAGAAGRKQKCAGVSVSERDGAVTRHTTAVYKRAPNSSGLSFTRSKIVKYATKYSVILTIFFPR